LDYPPPFTGGGGGGGGGIGGFPPSPQHSNFVSVSMSISSGKISLSVQDANEMRETVRTIKKVFFILYLFKN